MSWLNYSLYFGATLAPRVVNLLLVLILTRILPPTEYGLFVLVVTVGEILDLTCTGWIRILLLRNHSKRRGITGTRLGRICVLVCGTTALACLAALALGPVLVAGDPWRFILAILAYLIGNSILRFGLTLLQIREAHLAYSLIEGARSVLMIVMLAAALVVSTTDFFPAAMAMSLAIAMVGAAALRLGLRGVGRPVLPRSHYRTYFALGAPIIVVTLLAYTVAWLDRFVLNAYFDTAAVAIYAAAYTLGRQPIDVTANAVNMVGFPSLIRAYKRHDKAQAANVLSANIGTILFFGLAITALTAALAKPLVGLLLPETYREPARLLLPLVMSGAVLLAIKSFAIDNVFHVARRNWVQVLCLVPGALITVALELALVPPLGIYGAATGMLAGALTALVTAWLAATRYVPIRFPVAETLRSITAAGAGGAAACLIAQMEGLSPVAVLLIGGTVGLIVVFGAGTALGSHLLPSPAALAHRAMHAFERMRAGRPAARSR